MIKEVTDLTLGNMVWTGGPVEQLTASYTPRHDASLAVEGYDDVPLYVGRHAAPETHSCDYCGMVADYWSLHMYVCGDHAGALAAEGYEIHPL
jgi:hypothetical protein